MAVAMLFYYIFRCMAIIAVLMCRNPRVAVSGCCRDAVVDAELLHSPLPWFKPQLRSLDSPCFRSEAMSSCRLLTVPPAPDRFPVLSLQQVPASAAVPVSDENTGKADVVLASPTVPRVPCWSYQQRMERAIQAGLEMRGLLEAVDDTEQLAAHCLRVIDSQCFRGTCWASGGGPRCGPPSREGAKEEGTCWAWAILRGLPDDTGNEVRGLMWGRWSQVCGNILEETGQLYHRAVFCAFVSQDEVEEYWEAAMGIGHPVPVLPRHSPRQCDVGSMNQLLDLPCILPYAAGRPLCSRLPALS